MQFEELFLVRLCKPEDAQQDAQIIAPFIQELVREMGFFDPPDVDTLVELAYSLISTGFSEFVIAEIQKEPVGCIHINYRLSSWSASPYASVEDLYLRPNARRQKIGRSLVDYACQRAHARGCTYIDVHIPTKDKKVHAFFGRMGFQDVHLHCKRVSLPRERHCKAHAHTHEGGDV